MASEFWDLPELQRALATKSFGNVLRAYRASLGNVTQSQLADWLGLSQVQVSRIESGRSATNNLDKLARWSQILRIPPKLLWFGVPEPVAEDNSQVASVSFPTRARRLIPASRVSSDHVGLSLLTGNTPSTVKNARAIGHPEVETVREMTDTFRRLDNKFGGGHSRSAATQFLRTTVEPMMRDGQHKKSVRADLFSAAAELHHLVGWMAYDTGQAEDGRRSLQYALRLSQEVGNEAFAAEMLAGMSHHAAFFGAPGPAVELALASQQAARRAGLSVIESEAAVMEAHALAIQKDAQGCLAALQKAEDRFGRHETDLPSWMSYFDSEYLAAKFAHTFRDLGMPAQAEPFARQSLHMTAGYDRGRLFNTALLASILADQGQVDESCALAQDAVHMTRTVRSVRTVSYLADVADRLKRYDMSAGVQSLYGEMIESGIPTPLRG